MGSQTLSSLRELTERARAAQEAQRSRAVDAERAEQIRRDALDRAEAAAIIDTIKPRAAKQAALGRSHAVIMPARYDGAPLVDGDSYRIQPSQLLGASALVYAHCVNAGYGPSLEPQFDSRDDNAHRIRFCIVIRW